MLARRRSSAAKLDADEFIDFTEYPEPEALATKVKEVTGGGTRIARVAVSHQAVYDQAMDWLGFRGRLVCLGVPEGEVMPIAGARAGAMIGNELTVFAIKFGNWLEAKECLNIATRGLVKTQYQLRKMDELTDVSLLECIELSTLMNADLQRDARGQSCWQVRDRSSVMPPALHSIPKLSCIQ